jgi:hypothetical protein
MLKDWMIVVVGMMMHLNYDFVLKLDVVMLSMVDLYMTKMKMLVNRHLFHYLIRMFALNVP